MIAIESALSGIRVTVPAGEVPPAQLNRWLEWLRFKSIAQRSQMTEKTADRLANELKDDWWSANKNRFFTPP